MKKWNDAELVALDINMTESGGNPSKTEKFKNGKYISAGPDLNNHEPATTEPAVDNPNTIIDGIRGDVSTDDLS